MLQHKRNIFCQNTYMVASKIPNVQTFWMLVFFFVLVIYIVYFDYVSHFGSWLFCWICVGLCAEEIHVCGEPAAIDFIRELMYTTGEEVEVSH